VLPPDTGKSALDILGAELPDTEGVHQRSCNYCHAAFSETGADPTVFKLRLPPGSTRTLANWLDTPPEVQARIIAFGSHGVYTPGVAYSNMAGYYKMYSRAEIERVVQYIRTQATIQIETIKLNDASNKPVKRRLPRPPKTVKK
jgi:mono/diheme cytochrome c family protein